MWRLPPIILLVSCAANEQKDAPVAETDSVAYRIINTQDLVLDTSAEAANKESSRTFQGTETNGSIQMSGVWSLRTSVVHSRLRCATYETAIQVGRGHPGCKNVKWMTEADFGSSCRHCNSAVMTHTGSGQLANNEEVYNSSTCARVVTKCTGAC